MQLRITWPAALALVLAASVPLAPPGLSAPRREATPAARKRPPGSPVPAMTREEAQRNVAMLDDAYQLIVHEIHDWYPTRTGQPVVAATTVRELQEIMVRKGWPTSRFLAVSGPVMNPDHRPRDTFEEKAAAALRAGRTRYEEVNGRRLRVATVVPLEGGCFTCHWTTNKRGSLAAISWSLPLLPARPAKRTHGQGAEPVSLRGRQAASGG